MKETLEKVSRFISSHELIEKNDRVLLSLSAGKDSMTMLHVMLRLSESLRFEMGVFHLNQHLSVDLYAEYQSHGTLL